MLKVVMALLEFMAGLKNKDLIELIDKLIPALEAIRAQAKGRS